MTSLLFKAAATAALAMAATSATATPTLQFTPVAPTAAVGTTFTLQLQGSGFDLAAGGGVIDNLTGGQKLDVGFGAGMLELLSVTLDPRWTFAAANKPGTIDNAAGTVTGIGFGSFPATADDAFYIATFSFRALAAGDATVQVQKGEMVGRVAGVAGQLIAVDLPAITVTVTAVPEVSTWALFALGLAGIALRGRRARG